MWLFTSRFACAAEHVVLVNVGLLSLGKSSINTNLILKLQLLLIVIVAVIYCLLSVDCAGPHAKHFMCVVKFDPSHAYLFEGV